MKQALEASHQQVKLEIKLYFYTFFIEQNKSKWSIPTLKILKAPNIT
jgi:hypothetical protein